MRPGPCVSSSGLLHHTEDADAVSLSFTLHAYVGVHTHAPITHMYTLDTCKHAYTHTHMHTLVHVYTHHTCTTIHICTCIRNEHITDMCAHTTHTHAYTLTHTNMHVPHMYMQHTCVHTHAHIHTCTSHRTKPPQKWLCAFCTENPG